MGISFRWNAPRVRFAGWDEIKGALKGAKRLSAYAAEENYRDFVETPAKDAYWSITHPKQRILGQGRAQGPLITEGKLKGMRLSAGIMPMGGGAGIIPKEFKSSIPG